MNQKVVEFVVAKLHFIENVIGSGLGFETTLTFELEWCRMSFVEVFEMHFEARNGSLVLCQPRLPHD